MKRTNIAMYVRLVYGTHKVEQCYVLLKKSMGYNKQKHVIAKYKNGTIVHMSKDMSTMSYNIALNIFMLNVLVRNVCPVCNLKRCGSGRNFCKLPLLLTWNIIITNCYKNGWCNKTFTDNFEQQFQAYVRRNTACLCYFRFRFKVQSHLSFMLGCCCCC